jgi:hypothetical protein
VVVPDQHSCDRGQAARVVDVGAGHHDGR